MNAAQLYKDELYAYVEDPPRGRTPLGAAMVRLRGQESRKSTYDTNRRTYALITVVQPGTTEGGHYGKHSYCKEGQELTVPARHLIDFWNDYEAETAQLRKEREERQRESRRKALRTQVLTTVITWKLQHMGIHMLAPTVNSFHDGSGNVTFPLTEIMGWLDIDEEEINERIDEMMEV